MKKILFGLTALAVTQSVRVADACYACGNAFITWSTRLDVCAPSETLLVSAVSCWCGAGCVGACSGWCSSYAACEVSGDPACVFAGGTVACDECVASVCAAATSACSADTAGCVTCAGWLAGGDGDNLCPTSIDPARTLSACACTGPCANKCGNACTLYADWVLDPLATTPACDKCLQDAAKCGPSYGPCVQ